MSSYRFGVIGFGSRGFHHMKTAEALPGVDARCVAVADPRDPTPEEQARFGNRFYQDYRELIAKGEDLDYVIVASPDVAHVEQAVAALEAGIPVFLEKAVAFTWEEAIKLYHTVVAKNYPLFIGYNLRRFPAALGLKQVLDQGRIGKVQAVLIHINTGNRWSGNVVSKYDSPPYSDLMLGKLTHDLDTIQHILGTEIKDVVATATRNYWPVLRPTDAFAAGDVYSLSGLFKNNVLYTVHLTTTGPDYERRFMVNGSEGQVEAVLHTSRPGVAEASVTLWRVGEEPQTIPITAETAGGHGGADPRIHTDFIEWLATKPSSPNEPLSILTGTMTSFAGYESLATGKRIDVAAMLADALQQKVLA